MHAYGLGVPHWARYDPGPPPDEGWPTWQDAERELAAAEEQQRVLEQEQRDVASVGWERDSVASSASDEPGTPGQQWPVLQGNIWYPSEEWHEDPEQAEDWEQWQQEWEACNGGCLV